jgi:hypothetical protein
MSAALVKLVSETAKNDLNGFFAEEIAYCMVLCASGDTNPFMSAMATQAALWSEIVTPPERPTEGSRQQPLMREIIDDLEENKIEGFHWEELAFLCTVHDIMAQAADISQFSRPLELLRPHMEACRARRDKLPVSPGIPALKARITVVAEGDILDRPIQDLRKFAGVELSFRGPVFKHRGFLKIVGNVPDSCAVVVESGTCYVNGFVLGKIAATGNCEVRETISGIAISAQRAVRARSILNQAVIIAKNGRVGCFSTQSPKIVYAGTQIRIVENAVQGHYCAPRIRVGGNVDGGDWHISATMRGGSFLHSDERPLAIIFRKSLSCLDYGEAIVPQGRATMSTRNRLLSHIDHLEKSISQWRAGLQASAEIVLLYMCCGERIQQLISEVEGLQNRAAILDRIISAGSLLKRVGTERARLSRAADRLAGTDTGIEQVLSELASELRNLARDNENFQEIHQTWEHMMGQFNAISPEASMTKISRLLDSTLERLDTWTRQRRALAQELEVKQGELGEMAGQQEILEKARSSGNLVPILHQVLRAALTKDSQSVTGQRVRSSFVTHMVRDIEKRSNRLKIQERQVGRQRQQVKETEGRLIKDFHVPLPSAEKENTITGVFAPGGRIYVNDHQESIETILLGQGIEMKDSQKKKATYRCRENGDVVFETSAQKDEDDGGRN